jgi:hypothetical protein
MFVTRITIRVTGKKPWAVSKIAELMRKIERSLQRGLAIGEFNLSFNGNARARQIITDLDVFHVSLTAPRNAVQAKAEGFLREENPFHPETTAHARWDRVYMETDS